MTTKTTGGPAFPLVGFADGMTLRDYFAAAAMQGFLANPSLEGDLDEYASDAYRQADRMLKERDK
jgi:hypothetical protein